MGAKPSTTGGYCGGATCDTRPEELLPRTLLAGLFAAQAAVVFASNAGYLGGLTNVEVGKKYPTLTMPAGWAFAIWGLIYSWEAVAYAAMLASTPHPSKHLEAAAPFLNAANVLQLLWAVAFCRERLTVSAILMIALALSLWAAAAELHGAKEKWLIGVVTSIRAGWVAAATLVNVNICLAQNSAAPAVRLAAAFATCHVALFAGAVVAATTGDAPYALALAWALLAVGAEVKASKAGGDGVAVAALRGTALCAAGALVWLAATAVVFEYVVEPWHA